jgi:REP element-mobilizing transposase RayT
MPTRNKVKQYGEDEYYHVYNRGVNKDLIFREDKDYWYFLSLLKRHLSPISDTDYYGRIVKKYHEDIELVAFCLMPNHFHLLIYLKKSAGLANLMRSIMTSYTMYFNKKYKRKGHLYQDVFLASRINNEFYYWHISRYIHLNPAKNFLSYPYSSLDYFVGKKSADWIHPERIVTTDKERADYLEFVNDYRATGDELAELKHILASQS